MKKMKQLKKKDGKNQSKQKNLKELADPYRNKLETMLDKFKKDALAKYDRGRREHSDDISKLDLREEMWNEFIDMFNYFSFDK